MGMIMASQTGTIPFWANSINFLVDPRHSDAVLSVNGSPIPLVQVAGGRLADDVSVFRGSVVQLTFSPTDIPGYPDKIFYFDGIQFSFATVPEPSLWPRFLLLFLRYRATTSRTARLLKSMRIIFLSLGVSIAASLMASAQIAGTLHSGGPIPFAAAQVGADSAAPGTAIAVPAPAQTNITAAQASPGFSSDPIAVKLKNAPLSLVLQTLSDAAGYVINSELGTGSASTRIRSNTLTLSKDSMGKQELADLLISTLFRAGVVWKIDGGRIVTLRPMAEAQSADPAIGISNPNRTGSGTTTNQVGDYFSLVGIIDYKQGLMPGLAGTKAFFNGNKPEFVRGIRMGDTIAREYKVTKIDAPASTRRSPRRPGMWK